METLAAAQQADRHSDTTSAISWPAVIAGSLTSVAVAFIFLAAGAGFGLGVDSPWPRATGLAIEFTPWVGAWLIVVQVAPNMLGGYLAGRLRTRWLRVHTHEVHFRDTAHGLLVWALATIAGIVLAATIWGAADQSLSVPVSVAVTQQFGIFMTIGLLLSAFTAAVAGAIGGMRRDEMHEKLLP